MSNKKGSIKNKEEEEKNKDLIFIYFHVGHFPSPHKLKTSTRS